MYSSDPLFHFISVANCKVSFCLCACYVYEALSRKHMYANKPVCVELHQET
jgi:hypothetical protein